MRSSISRSPSTSTPPSILTFPINVDIPAAYKSVVVTRPENLAFLHRFPTIPRSYVSSSFGLRSDINSPPTLISSLVASPRLIVPPLKVATPINSEVPLTFKLSFTNKSLPTYKSPPVVVIPPAEARVETPLIFKDSAVNGPKILIDGVVIPSVELIVTPEPTVIMLFVPSTTIAPVPNVTTPTILASPPTFKFLAIPTPPLTITAPVVVDVELVVLENVTIPVAIKDDESIVSVM